MNRTFLAMKKHLRMFLGFLLLGLFAWNLIGCNTMKGLGKDLEEAGRSISESAERHD